MTTDPAADQSPRFGLKASVIQQITAVFAKYPAIESVILYGSRAKGTYRNGSDIDLTFTDADLEADVLYRVDTELDDLLLPYSFDLSLLKEIENPKLLKHIQRAGITFYQRQK
jgi:predicted nucleotidyltransferase